MERASFVVVVGVDGAMLLLLKLRSGWEIQMRLQMSVLVLERFDPLCCCYCHTCCTDRRSC